MIIGLSLGFFVACTDLIFVPCDKRSRGTEISFGIGINDSLLPQPQRRKKIEVEVHEVTERASKQRQR